nr:carboxypeptidase-like regulatory domain-containing protein [uncultured Carboxylicivirga sp.]
MRIKSFLVSSFLLTFTLSCISQTITGRIIDSKTQEALCFVNIGIINTAAGTITDENGSFKLNVKDIIKDAEVQITMIGYRSQSYSINELLQDINLIKLDKAIVQLPEVVVEYDEEIKKVGTQGTNLKSGVCGWGGTKFGEGNELGLELDLGEMPVKIEDLNLKVHKQSFESSMFRLHIRTIEGGKPDTEMLTENIYFEITRFKGWEKVDLSKYNIVVSGKVALTIEWIKVTNVIEQRLVKMNGSKQGAAVVLFELNKRNGKVFTRRGSAAQWKIGKGESPVFYITTKG